MAAIIEVSKRDVITTPTAMGLSMPSLEARLLPGESSLANRVTFLVFRQSKVGVSEMGVVTC